MKAVEPSGRGVRPGAQGRGLRDLFPSHSGDCGVLGSLYTYASDRTCRQPQPHTPFPRPPGFSLLPGLRNLSVVRAHPRKGGRGQERAGVRVASVDLPTAIPSSTPIPAAPSP